MKSLFKRLDGRLSQELLARPSRLAIGQANLRIALILCSLICLTSLAFTIVQWRVAEGLYDLQSKRVESSVKQLLIAQSMMVTLTNVHRFAYNALLAKNDAERALAEKQHAASLQLYQKQLEQISLHGTPEDFSAIERLKSHASHSAEVTYHIMDMAKNGQLEEALTLRLSQMRPAVISWQEEQLNFSSEIAKKEAGAQEKSARMVSVARLTLLILLVVPAVIFILGILATLAVLGWQHLSISKLSKDDAWIR